MRIIGNDQKNNGQNFWEILERIIGKILSIIGAGLFIALLAKVPALSCRLGRVSYDHAFGALTSGCAPYDRAIVRYLFIAKKFD